MPIKNPTPLCIALLACSAFGMQGPLNESAPASASTDSIPWPNPTMAGCEEERPYTLLDDFADGDQQDEWGGYWGSLVDPADGSPKLDSSWDLKSSDKGSNPKRIFPGEELNGQTSAGRLELTATLRQCQEPNTDSRSGSASIINQFTEDEMLSRGDSLTGISFQITRRKAGPLVRSLRFFAIQEEYDSGWSERGVDIPFSKFDTSETRKTCIRPSDLRTIGHSENAGFGTVDPRRFFQFEWLVKMPSSPNPFAAFDTTIFSLTDVRFHGSENFKSEVWVQAVMPGLIRDYGPNMQPIYIPRNSSPSRRQYKRSLHWNTTCTNPNVGTRTRSRPAPTLAVHTESNSLLLTGTDGFRQFEILSADGRSLKRFAPTSRLQIGLPRGAYLLVGEGPNKREVRPFAVAR